MYKQTSTSAISSLGLLIIILGGIGLRLESDLARLIIVVLQFFTAIVIGYYISQLPKK